MNMHRRARLRRVPAVAAVVVAVSAVAAATGSAAAAGNAPLPTLQHLDPGGRADLPLEVPVTVVYVGLEEGFGPTEIWPDGVLGNQPVSSRPREYAAYEASGGVEGDLGIDYRYDIRQVFAGQEFEDAFFGHLTTIGHGPFRPTPVQAAYSAHPLAAEEITQSLDLDATMVESWLTENAPLMLGVDTTRPTVFFLNWYGRDDFQFHTYTASTYQPEVDLFAPHWVRNHTIAWGGGVPDVPQTPTTGTGRVWFMDVSAGPDYWTVNWMLDIGDLDGDGIDDDRIPPVWEYGTDHWFRPFDCLGCNLSAVLRYVAIDLLFTPGPLHDVGISAPLLDDALELDINVFEKQPDGELGGVVVPEILRRFQALDPSRSFTADVEVNEFTPSLDRAYQCASTPGPADPRYCHPGNQAHGDASAGGFNNSLELLNWASNHENQYLDGRRGELPVALFDVDHPHYQRILGASWAQRWNLVLDTPLSRRTRVSPSHTLSHEVGHYLGLRHPHDGYDVERNQKFSAGGGFFFVSLGDESASIMSYLHSQVDFSQFDRDNLDRWLTAARFDAANEILGSIYSSPRAAQVTAELVKADHLAGVAIDRLHNWDLRGASIAARDAYRIVLSAASKAGVHVEPRSPIADVRSQGPWWHTDAVDDRHRITPDGHMHGEGIRREAP